jgi:hypothetical protein
MIIAESKIIILINSLDLLKIPFLKSPDVILNTVRATERRSKQIDNKAAFAIGPKINLKRMALGPVLDGVNRDSTLFNLLSKCVEKRVVFLTSGPHLA